MRQRLDYLGSVTCFRLMISLIFNLGVCFTVIDFKVTFFCDSTMVQFIERVPS